MFGFGKKSAGKGASASVPPPPPKLHFGCPVGATCIASDPLQGTIAVGTFQGEVKLFGSSSAQLMLPAVVVSPIRHLVLSAGHLLAIHEPNTLCVWSLRRKSRHLASLLASITPPPLEEGCADPVTRTSHIPSTPLVLLGTAHGNIRVLDLEAAALAPWRLELSQSESTAIGGPLCALELNPSSPRRLLVGGEGGLLKVCELAHGGAPPRAICTFGAPRGGGRAPGRGGGKGGDGAASGGASGGGAAAGVDAPGLTVAAWAAGDGGGGCRVVLAGYITA